ncbi:MAG: BLUF domain-containing protein [Pseudomonadales bacterium]|jgi:hypothetical protein|nr:BLUF domain-containing protein [Pseudomonadales bacterium]
MELLATAYVSQARPGLELRELKQLLRRAREYNFRHEVTGLLLHDGPHFAQWLEGPPEIVDVLLARIDGDARHEGLRVVLREETDERRFPDWAMGCARLAGAEAGRLRAVTARFVGEAEPDRETVVAYFAAMRRCALPAEAPALAL